VSGVLLICVTRIAARALEPAASRDAGAAAVILETGGSLSVTMPEGPRRKGYGSELIERALPYQLNAKTQLEFGPDGVCCTIAVPVRLSNEGSAHG